MIRPYNYTILHKCEGYHGNYSQSARARLRIQTFRFPCPSNDYGQLLLHVPSHLPICDNWGYFVFKFDYFVLNVERGLLIFLRTVVCFEQSNSWCWWDERSCLCNKTCYKYQNFVVAIYNRANKHVCCSAVLSQQASSIWPIASFKPPLSNGLYNSALTTISLKSSVILSLVFRKDRLNNSFLVLEYGSNNRLWQLEPYNCLFSLCKSVSMSFLKIISSIADCTVWALQPRIHKWEITSCSNP